MTQSLDEFLRKSPLVAILRGVKPDEIADIAEVLLSCGVYIIEVPLNSPEAPLESIRILAEVVGDRGICGAGTVLNPQQVNAVAEAGGQLIVTPNTNPIIIKEALSQGLYAVPGCLTPTEAFIAIEAGATHIKLFPGGDFGATYVASVHAVLPPEITTLVVGGAHAGNLAELWAAGARGFGFGTNIYTPGDTSTEVASKAKTLVAAVQPLI